MELEPLQSFMQATWNALNAVPISQWLVPSQSREDKERIHCLGNITVPACAALGGNILARMLREADC